VEESTSFAVASGASGAFCPSSAEISRRRLGFRSFCFPEYNDGGSDAQTQKI
jgi:hypothetical protein